MSKKRNNIGFLLCNEIRVKELVNVLEQIDVMKKAILARAFRGELATNDHKDENTIELLKKILEV